MPLEARLSTVRIRRDPAAPFPVDLDQFELRAIQPGQEIDVPAELAGRPPHWRRLADGEQQVPWHEYRTHAGHLEVRDLGHGLLAQLGNWLPVTDQPPAPQVGGTANTEGSGN